MNWNLAIPQGSQFALVIIDQNNLMAKVRKTGTRHQTHIS
jgi:hypothetical protein